MAFDEFHKFIDKAALNQKQLGESRQMIQRAWHFLNVIERDERKIPAWLARNLSSIKDALTFESNCEERNDGHQ